MSTDERSADAPIATGAALAEGTIGPGILRTWVESIRAINDEVPLEFADDGLHAGVVNPEQVASVQTRLHPQAFDEYFHAGETEHRRIVDLAALKETASLADTDAEKRVTLRCDGADQPLYVRAGPVERTVATYETLSNAEPPALDIDWPYRAAIPRDELKHAAKAGRVPFVGGCGGDEAYQFHGDADGRLELVADGDTDRVEQTIEVADVIHHPDEAVRGLYGGDFVRAVVATIPKGATVAFQFGAELPFRLRWVLREEVHGEETIVAEPSLEVVIENGVEFDVTVDSAAPSA